VEGADHGSIGKKGWKLDNKREILNFGGWLNI
jgi:hypothetical protein